MKISVITVCYNAQATIENTLVSVGEQSYGQIEHLVIDGASQDDTMHIVEKYHSRLAAVISEPDKGIYDAMNKGIAIATGDVIGFLNADDIYDHPDVLKRIASAFENERTEVVYGDLIYFYGDNPNRVVRYFSSRRFRRDRIKFGWMPAHPTLYLRRKTYDRLGNYRTDYRIASDFEFIVRLFWHYQPVHVYLPEIFVRMRMGGISTKNLLSHLIVNSEMVSACKKNGLNTNFFNMSLKVPLKLAERFFKPS